MTTNQEVNARTLSKPRYDHRAPGSRPLWARSQRELFFLDGTGRLSAAAVQTASTFRAETPRVILSTRYHISNQGRTYDVAPDGRRFLMIKETRDEARAGDGEIVVVSNWVPELNARFDGR